jgi:hypothetical protein
MDSLSSVLANPARLAVLAIVSQNIGIVTKAHDPKFLCFNGLRRIVQCGILTIVASYVMS